jgi:hypothetical protein
MRNREEKEIRHIISISVTDTEESPIASTRFSRTLRVRTALGDELILTLSSESRLALILQQKRDDKQFPTDNSSIQPWRMPPDKP